MELKGQVCSLELSKILNELGIKQESYFYWVPIKNNQGQEYIGLHCPTHPLMSDISAFTAAELGQILPNCVVLPNANPFDNYRLYIHKFYSVNEDRSVTNNYIVNYECDSTGTEGETAWLRRKLTNNNYDENLANAMAKMLIYIIQNKLIEISK